MAKKRKMTKAQHRKAERIVKKLKGKPGLNPYAVANATVKKSARRRKR